MRRLVEATRIAKERGRKTGAAQSLGGEASGQCRRVSRYLAQHE